MSDLGDAFRESRYRRQDMRRSMKACGQCGLKKQIGEPCHKCEEVEWLVWSRQQPVTPQAGKGGGDVKKG